MVGDKSRLRSSRMLYDFHVKPPRQRPVSVKLIVSIVIVSVVMLAFLIVFGFFALVRLGFLRPW